MDAPEGARTPDHRLIRPKRCQLRHESYRTLKVCLRWVSNPRPWDYETHALPTAPQRLDADLANRGQGRVTPHRPAKAATSLRYPKVLDPGIEPGTYCVLGSRHNQLDQPSFIATLEGLEPPISRFVVSRPIQLGHRVIACGISPQWRSHRNRAPASGPKKTGVMGESNSRPLRPERRIMPLDQSPLAVENERHLEDSNFRGNTPSRFLIYRLNHSAKVPLRGSGVGGKKVLPGLEPGPLDSESRVLTN